jgi:hypothetical protein
MKVIRFPLHEDGDRTAERDLLEPRLSVAILLPVPV